MTITDKSNVGAAIGAGIVTVVVFVLSGIMRYLNTSTVLPTTVEGWIQLILPSLIAGLLAALTPYYQKGNQPEPAPVVGPPVGNPIAKP